MIGGFLFCSKAGDDDDYSTARVLVSDAQNPIHTQQPGLCGEEGDHIQISDRFLKSYKQTPQPFDNDGV